jgi:hypothetical protein
MQPQARERDIFRASRRKWVATPKFRPTAGSLRSDGRQGSKPASRRSARASLRVLDCLLAPASVLLWGSGRSPRSIERRFDVDCHGGRKLVET